MNPMTRTTAGSIPGFLALALVFTANARIGAQETSPAPSPTRSSSLPATPADASAKSATTSSAKGKKGKQEYTGPTTVIELPPTPMLDEEGKQRQDPDGKLMFNPPVRQQRDKKGHPLFDEQGKPLMQTKDNLGYDENGKKIHPAKEKPPKLVSV